MIVASVAKTTKTAPVKAESPPPLDKTRENQFLRQQIHEIQQTNFVLSNQVKSTDTQLNSLQHEVNYLRTDMVNIKSYVSSLEGGIKKLEEIAKNLVKYAVTPAQNGVDRAWQASGEYLKNCSMSWPVGSSLDKNMKTGDIGNIMNYSSGESAENQANTFSQKNSEACYSNAMGQPVNQLMNQPVKKSIVPDQFVNWKHAPRVLAVDDEFAVDMAVVVGKPN